VKGTKSNAAGGEPAAFCMGVMAVSERQIVPLGYRPLELVFIVEGFVEAIDLLAVAGLEQLHHVDQQVMDLQLCSAASSLSVGRDARMQR